MIGKTTINDVRALFASRGYTLITDVYANSKQKFEYVCPNGHRHAVRLDHFKSGTGCPYCSDKFKKSIEYIRPYFEKEGYVLLSTNYVGAFGELECSCPVGHKFKTSWHNWKSGGRRCPVCNGGVRSSQEDVEFKLRNEGYSLLGPYKNADIPLECMCPNGHVYKVTIGNFISKGSRCPICSGRGVSSAEFYLRSFLDSMGLFLVYNDRDLINPYEIDILVPDYRIAIEYCGLYWHSEAAGKDKNYHLNKLNLCRDKGYRLITIFEDEFLFKKDIVFSRLQNIFKATNRMIYARNCKIMEIPPRQAKAFCEENHLQGYGSGSSVKLGAFFMDELVSVMTFAKPSISKGAVKREGSYELHRFCNKLNTIVVGGASKMLKRFVDNYSPKFLFSYADRRWSSGKLYERIGFKFANFTEPNYWYFKSKKRIHRFALRKTEEDPDDITEKHLRIIEGWDRIWDCGNIKYTMEVR